MLYPYFFSIEDRFLKYIFSLCTFPHIEFLHKYILQCSSWQNEFCSDSLIEELISPERMIMISLAEFSHLHHSGSKRSSMENNGCESSSHQTKIKVMPQWKHSGRFEQVQNGENFCAEGIQHIYKIKGNLSHLCLERTGVVALVPVPLPFTEWESQRLLPTSWTSHMSWDGSFHPAPEDVSSLYTELEFVISRARPCPKITQNGVWVTDFSLF